MQVKMGIVAARSPATMSHLLRRDKFTGRFHPEECIVVLV